MSITYFCTDKHGNNYLRHSAGHHEPQYAAADGGRPMIARFVNVGPDVAAAWVDLDGRRYLVRLKATGELWTSIDQRTVRNSSWNGSGVVWSALPLGRRERLRPRIQALVSAYIAEHGRAELNRDLKPEGAL